MPAARRTLVVLLGGLLLAGCASPADDDPTAAPSSTAAEDPAGDPTAGDPAAGGIAQADNDLQVELELGDGSPPQTWTLTCVGFVEGSHPEAQAACDHLAGMDDPFAPLPEDVVCSQEYGGPQTATVIGRWAGEPVDLAVSRVDGCRIAQWNSLVPLVPAVESGELPG